ELRLGQSFRDQRLLLEALAMIYGPRTAGLLLAIGNILKAVSEEAAHSESKCDWLTHPFFYDEAMKAVSHLLDRARPEGEIVTPRVPPWRLDPHFGPQPEMEEAIANYTAAKERPGTLLANGEIGALL